jgi:hypothetical protein
LGRKVHPVPTPVKHEVTDDSGPLAAWHVLAVHDLEVLQGRLYPGLRAGDPEVRRLLDEWAVAYVRDDPSGIELTLARTLSARRRERWWLHLLLFALTLVTTTYAGALIGVGPAELRWLGYGTLAIPVPSGAWLPMFAAGLWFSLPLCAILGAHEMGHFVAARRHAIDVSPPYFIPAPWLVNLIGTFGAFIRLRSPLLNRVALLDVGAAGPLAGFLVAVPVTAAGLALSRPLDQAPTGGWTMGVSIVGEHLPLGESALLLLLSSATGSEAPFLELHPLAFAGWVGLFFTALNLFPVGQLDGGHISFALSAAAHRVAAAAAVGILLALALVWPGWLVWVGVILVVGRGRIFHPPVLDPEFPLDPARRRIAWLCAAIFLVTLVPVPFPL